MSTFFRQATNVARSASRVRAFASTSASRKDLVQDLYLSQIKAYKPAPPAKDAHVGVVKAYSLPPSPVAPSLPSDLAAELTAYDAVEPTKVEVAVASGSAEEVAGAEAYLSFLEADIPKPEAHH
ncbi:ATP synthase complex subunit H-domain-containing protein [Collybia nuda]|uniref:ATP synthase complex subunit H-domain-containing protein n=1 Tax=Collybia nuda TaxID=64659 RepID=A0A9P6CK13_9AGAR|nr:ATP synthase complex subunit H-domain-containing protein [Collybia nuda]